MIMNRIADVFFIFIILITLLIFKTCDYITIFQLIPFVINESFVFGGISFNLITLFSLFIFIGGVGKSAQIGLHT